MRCLRWQRQGRPRAARQEFTDEFRAGAAGVGARRREVGPLVVCPRNGFTHRCPWPTGPRRAILVVPIEGCPWSLRNLNRKIVSGTYH